MTPKLASKAFSAKSTQYIRLECHKGRHNLDTQTGYVAARVVIDTQNDYRNPAVHAPRVNRNDIRGSPYKSFSKIIYCGWLWLVTLPAMV
jgi:hypothetical protein